MHIVNSNLLADGPSLSPLPVVSPCLLLSVSAGARSQAAEVLHYSSSLKSDEQRHAEDGVGRRRDGLLAEWLRGGRPFPSRLAPSFKLSMMNASEPSQLNQLALPSSLSHPAPPKLDPIYIITIRNAHRHRDRPNSSIQVKWSRKVKKKKIPISSL